MFFNDFNIQIFNYIRIKEHNLVFIYTIIEFEDNEEVNPKEWEE